MTGNEHSRRRAARSVLSKAGYKMGGHLSERKDRESDKHMIEKAFEEHDDQLHGGKKTKLKLKHGGLADGGEAAQRNDRASRGKSGKGKTHVNIVIAPRGQDRPVPVPVPVGAHPPGAAPGGAPPVVTPPPPPGMMPPGAMPPPGGMPPGVGMRPPMPPMGGAPGGPMPMMRKSGGRAGEERDEYREGGRPHHASGGRTKRALGGTSMPQSMATPQNGVYPGTTMPTMPSPALAPAPQNIGMGPPQKRGGRAKHAEGGSTGVGTGRLRQDDGGAGSGNGRLSAARQTRYSHHAD